MTPGEVPGHRINPIHITDEGICYLAIDKGLATYDGKTFNLLKNKEKRTLLPIYLRK